MLCGSRLSAIAKVILATVITLPQFNSAYGELTQIICQKLAPVQSYCAIAALGIAEVILLRASPAGVPANIVRSAGPHRALTGLVTLMFGLCKSFASKLFTSPYCAVRLSALPG
jgi:hypothetical protein